MGCATDEREERRMKILKEVIIRYQTEDGVTVKAYEQEEVIRCKDCKYWVEVPYGHICDWTSHQKQSGEGYCELARKRKEE
jgi:hypothetical protein